MKSPSPNNCVVCLYCGLESAEALKSWMTPFHCFVESGLVGRGQDETATLHGFRVAQRFEEVPVLSVRR